MPIESLESFDVRYLDRLAVDATTDIVARLDQSDMAKPTPCAGWSVLDLVEHMAAQHAGFVYASRGGSDLEGWTRRPLGADATRVYLAASDAVSAAFAADGVLERSFSLPEVSPTLKVPGQFAIGFHMLDFAVHGWDLCRAIGDEYVLDDELAQAAVSFASLVPDGAERNEASSLFQPGLDIPDDASATERVLLALGRRPDWSVAEVGGGGPDGQNQRA